MYCEMAAFRALTSFLVLHLHGRSSITTATGIIGTYVCVSCTRSPPAPTPTDYINIFHRFSLCISIDNIGIVSMVYSPWCNILCRLHLLYIILLQTSHVLFYIEICPQDLYFRLLYGCRTRLCCTCISPW